MVAGNRRLWLDTSTNTVSPGGSSRVFNNVLAAARVIRSAGATTTTLQEAMLVLRARRSMSSRIWSMPMTFLFSGGPTRC